MIINLLTIAVLIILLRWISSDIMIEKRKKQHFVMAAAPKFQFNQDNTKCG